MATCFLCSYIFHVYKLWMWTIYNGEMYYVITQRSEHNAKWALVKPPCRYMVISTTKVHKRNLLQFNKRWKTAYTRMEAVAVWMDGDTQRRLKDRLWRCIQGWSKYEGRKELKVILMKGYTWGGRGEEEQRKPRREEREARNVCIKGCLKEDV